MAHHELIYAIGFDKLMELGASRSRIHNWRKRGVSWQYRFPVAQLAKEQGIPLPENFLDPKGG